MAMGQEAQRKPQILNKLVRIVHSIDRRIIGVSNDWSHMGYVPIFIHIPSSEVELQPN